MLDDTLMEWSTAHHEESGTRHSCDFESISRLREGDHITIFEHFLVHRSSSCDDEDKCIISFWNTERNTPNPLYQGGIQKKHIIKLDLRECFGSSFLLYDVSFFIFDSEFPSDHTHLSTIEVHFRNIFSCERLIAWSSHLVLAREIDPELDRMLHTSLTREFLCHELIVKESASRSHPLHFVGSYHPTMSSSILVLDLSCIHDRDRLKSSMWMKSYSWTMISLGRELPRSMVIEHEKWARDRTHITTISGDILSHTEPITHHMVRTRVFESDDFFLFHDPIIEKSGKKSTLFYKVNNNTSPYNRYQRNSDPKVSPSCFVIERCLHTEPYTKNSSQERKFPECFFGDSPPPVDRFYLVEPHKYVGEEIEDEEGCKICIHIISIFFP